MEFCERQIIENVVLLYYLSFNRGIVELTEVIERSIQPLACQSN